MPSVPLSPFYFGRCFALVFDGLWWTMVQSAILLITHQTSLFRPIYSCCCLVGPLPLASIHCPKNNLKLRIKSESGLYSCCLAGSLPLASIHCPKNNLKLLLKSKSGTVCLSDVWARYTYASLDIFHCFRSSLDSLGFYANILIIFGTVWLRLVTPLDILVS